MPETIEKTFITQFTEDVQYLAQKEQGVLYQYYKPITVTSVDGQAFDKSLPFELADSTNKRYEATSRKFAEWDRVWAYPVRGERAILHDKNDDLSMAFEPGSVVMQNGAKAINRWRDLVAYSALGATVKTGRNASGSESLSATAVASGGNLIPLDSTANGATGGNINGFSVEKLLAAKKFFYDNNVTDEPIYCVVSQNEINQLLLDPRVSSIDYNERKALAMGETNTYAGINFIRFHAPLDGVEGQATQKKVYFFSPNGLGFGDVRLNVKVDQLPDMRYDYQFYFEVISAAVRFDIQRVCYALVDQATTLDTGIADL